MRDPLTQLHNRRYVTEVVAENVKRVLRAYAGAGRGEAARNQDLVFFLVDVDHFKEVNDQLGHPVGDRLLVALAQRLAAVVRDSDLVVRWGGEEFLIVARESDRGEAEPVAERILEAVGGTPFELGDGADARAHLLHRMGGAALDPRRSGGGLVGGDAGARRPRALPREALGAQPGDRRDAQRARARPTGGGGVGGASRSTGSRPPAHRPHLGPAARLIASIRVPTPVPGLTLPSGLTYSRRPTRTQRHADLPSQHQHPRQGQHLRGAVRGRRRLWLVLEINRSPYVTQAGVARIQPVQFSHQHHVGGMGIDCRYCHTGGEVAAAAASRPPRPA